MAMMINDDLPEQVMREKMKKIERQVKDMSDELIVYMINVCADELDRRDWERKK